MSTRGGPEVRFDHGAQYFTVRDKRFRDQVRSWQARGLAAPWMGRIGAVAQGKIVEKSGFTVRFVGVPGMRDICRSISDELADCRFKWQVKSIERKSSIWRLRSASGEVLEADTLVLSTPPAQAADLLANTGATVNPGQVEMRPCWAVMAEFDRPLFSDWDGLFVNQGPLAWVAAQRTKPGRPGNEAWVLHASPDWSEANFDAQRVGDVLLDAAAALPGASKVRPVAVSTHRWRFALARLPLQQGALVDRARRLVLAGDWCHGSRVEGAFLSGLAAAESVLAL